MERGVIRSNVARPAYRAARAGRRLEQIADWSYPIQEGLAAIGYHRFLVAYDYYRRKPWARIRRRYWLSACADYHLIRLRNVEREETWINLDDDDPETHYGIEITFDSSDPDPDSCKILDSRIVRPTREGRRVMQVRYTGNEQERWRHAISYCLIAGSRPLEEKLLSLPMGAVWVPHDGWEYWEPPFYLFDLAVRALCANKTEEAREAWQTVPKVTTMCIHEYKGRRVVHEEYLLNMLDLFSGLIEGGPRVQAALEEHIRRDNNWSTINEEALAYVVLARRLGYDPRVDHFSLPRELIDSHTPPPSQPRSTP